MIVGMLDFAENLDEITHIMKLLVLIFAIYEGIIV